MDEVDNLPSLENPGLPSNGHDVPFLLSHIAQRKTLNDSLLNALAAQFESLLTVRVGPPRNYSSSNMQQHFGACHVATGILRIVPVHQMPLQYITNAKM